MSLLSHPRHTVTVIDHTLSQSPSGAVVLTPQPAVSLRVNVHPLSAEEAEAYGIVLTDTYRITCPPEVWPGSPHARILWDGQEYKQVGRPTRARLGRATQHDQILMRRGNNGVDS